MSRIAIIDMGTNTFHLLIAELRGRSYTILFRDHEAVKVGKGGINQGYITAEACERAMQAMKKFRMAIDKHQATKIYAFGTSALRNAANGPALAQAITTDTGIPIRIIPGEDEASLIFRGVNAAMDLGNNPNLIMDIGAGSVEFIIGNKHSLFWKQSFEIGGQRLLEIFHKSDPVAQEEIQALDLFLAENLKPLYTALQKDRPMTLVGSSGTFDTLSEIFSIRRDLHVTPADTETALDIPGFNEIYAELIHKNREERMQIIGMIEMRVDMIVVSSCLIRHLLEKHPFQNIRVSRYSLQEGVLDAVASGDII